MQRAEWKSALDIWRDGLVNLSGVNRLINFKSSKTGAVSIDSPDPDVILSGLRSSASWTFQGVEPGTPNMRTMAQVGAWPRLPPG